MARLLNLCGGAPAGVSGDPLVLRRGTFPLPSRRGGACPSRRFLERPRPAHPRSRTLCHGWSEPGAAVKWHRPKFCTAPGPSGPGGIIPGTIFCAPEILRKGIGVSPVNGGLGENELEPEGPCPDGDVSLPRRRFASFAAAGKGGRPAGRNPSHGTKPFRKTAGGSETRPYNISGRSPRNGTTEGQAPPLRVSGKHPAVFTRRLPFNEPRFAPSATAGRNQARL